MIYAVWIPLLVPFVVFPAARRLADALAPAQAVRLLAATGVGLALSTVLALTLLVVPGAGRLSVVAAAGSSPTRWPPPCRARPSRSRPPR